MSTEIVAVGGGSLPRRVERIQVTDVIPVLDTGRFEQMQRIAVVMASSGLIPDTLCTEGSGDRKVALPRETVIARCFLIVNQSVGWRMDPFAVAQCASVVHGRVCYEGKLIAAIVDNLVGVKLSYKWNDKQGDALGITVSGTLPGETMPREISGTVGQWKTTGKNSPWLNQPRTQLAYRGARDWARLHAPAAMLGVYSTEEMEDAATRQERLQSHLPPAPPPPPPASAAVVALPPAPPTPNAAPVVSQPQLVADAEFDFEAFRAELDKCVTKEELYKVYEAIVRGYLPPLTGEETDECASIYAEIEAKFYDEKESGAEPETTPPAPPEGGVKQGAEAEEQTSQPAASAPAPEQSPPPKGKMTVVSGNGGSQAALIQRLTLSAQADGVSGLDFEMRNLNSDEIAMLNPAITKRLQAIARAASSDSV